MSNVLEPSITLLNFKLPVDNLESKLILAFNSGINREKLFFIVCKHQIYV